MSPRPVSRRRLKGASSTARFRRIQRRVWDVMTRLDAAAHTYLNTASFGESCGVCHGPNADFAVAKVHAK